MAVAASGTATISGITTGTTVGVVVNGTSVTVTKVLNGGTTAASLAVAINANATVNLLVLAVAVGTVVTLTAVLPGTAGNSITLVAVGSEVAVSGATLTGGVADLPPPIAALISLGFEQEMAAFIAVALEI